MRDRTDVDFDVDSDVDRDVDSGRGAGAPDLTGRVALITGGSRGLGRAMAHAFSLAGAEVVIAARKAADCERAAAEIAEATGRPVHAFPTHVGDWDQCTALIERTTEEVGGLHVLVNNAGIAPLYESPDLASEALFDKTIGVNLKGPLRLGSLAGRWMAGHDGGSIINISSIAASRPTEHEIVYGAAKAGVQVLTSGLALAYGPKVRANTIVAGPFLTDIARGWDMAAFDEFAGRMPLRRAGQPDEIVGAALYFASDASRFTTGAMLTVDGGMALVRQ